MIWWADQPGRARQEQIAIGELAERSLWLSNIEIRPAANLRLAFDFDIRIGERTIPLTLVYPDFFPDAAPSIFARDRKLLSGHQYGAEGELCLEHRPDNWVSDITGAMMIESAYRLLSSEQETGQAAPSEHRVTREQCMRFSQLRLLFSVDTLSGLSLIAEGQAVEGNVLEQETAGTYVAQISRIGSADTPLWSEIRKRGGEALAIRAVIARIPEGGGRPCKDFDELRALLWSCAFAPLASELANRSDCNFLILFDGIRLQASLIFGEVGKRLIVSYDAIFAEKDTVRLDPEYERLRAAKIAVVGCGSVGSKVAVQLARSGIGNFVLVDGDVFASGNLVRNELDWRSVGVHKAPALGARLKEINPDCTVNTRTNLIGGQESGTMASATLAAITECDLIIDATAEPRVFNLCAAIAKRAKKPMCWAQVFGGGAGGIVVRLRPGIDPTPVTARRRIEAWYLEQGVEWPDEGSSQPYADSDGSGSPLIADDSEVSVIASHLARFVIDVLSRPEATIFPYSAYVIGLKERWLFAAPFDVRPIDLGKCDLWGAEKAPGDTEAFNTFISALFPSQRHES